ncbi:hypothetical protein CRUP_031665, partial [Coryphaenoides rupestris]
MAACSQTAGDDHEVLSVRPWLPVCIGERPLLAKAWFGDTAYHILLTDTCCVWEERMDTAEGEAQVSLVHPGDGGGLSIRLKSELAGLPFHWEFHCTRPAVDMVCAQLVRPLLVMSRLLQAQVDQLGALLARKDAEIQDYKENGATLSR